ncbi:NOTCH2 [Branchiostoma lanceolatum]|uniref:NOTCH2 protein n=1 Tax=Branchiostoma lanceolatum TaxID=7740 RepID=A0A8J9ZLL0_BRALA|nr:NOTCH2 [Branchiostoma lanceolatum]
MWKFLLLTVAVVTWPAETQAGTFLATYLGRHYFKVQVSGPMTSANVKATCEAAGYVTPCIGTICQFSSHDCVQTGLTECGYPMMEVSQVLCGDVPYRCPAFDGVYVFMEAGWNSGAAYGYEGDIFGVNGNNYYNRYAFCTQDVDQCGSAPCQNGATCQDGLNSFTCQCAPGYAGTLCEAYIDECMSAPCRNGATCLDEINSFTCQCAPGYAGTLCEAYIDECMSAPCRNGATCLDEMNGFTCRCAPGFIDALCATNIDECASSPCLGGATCIDDINKYRCACPIGHTGERCEMVTYAGGCLLFSSDAVSYPEASQECQNRGGHLVDVKEAELQRLIADSIPTGSDVSLWIGLKLSPGVMMYTDGTSVSGQLQWLPNEPTTCDLCAYLDGTNGYLATTASCLERHHYVCQSDPTPCQQNVCFNNGVCSTCFNDASSSCFCLPGYEGDLCNMDIDECSSNPCQNGGVCFNAVNSYACHCTAGYGGDNCQTDLDLCAQVVCPFNWQCQDHGDHFICNARSTRLMDTYACSSASCPDGMYCKEERTGSFSCRAG